jgi:hypothetical protein
MRPRPPRPRPPAPRRAGHPCAPSLLPRAPPAAAPPEGERRPAARPRGASEPRACRPGPQGPPSARRASGQRPAAHRTHQRRKGLRAAGGPPRPARVAVRGRPVPGPAAPPAIRRGASGRGTPRKVMRVVKVRGGSPPRGETPAGEPGLPGGQAAARPPWHRAGGVDRRLQTTAVGHYQAPLAPSRGGWPGRCQAPLAPS